MVKVYRIVNDVDKYQGLSIVRGAPGNLTTNMFDGSSLRDEWSPPQVYSLYPKKNKPDFWKLWAGGATLVSGPDVTEKVYSAYARAGELLPLPFDGELFTVLNVTECIDCLDRENSRWMDELKIGRPVKYAFYGERMSSSLFKIPETCRAEIFALEIDGDPLEEFKAIVEAENLSGLRFELLSTIE